MFAVSAALCSRRDDGDSRPVSKELLLAFDRAIGEVGDFFAAFPLFVPKGLLEPLPGSKYEPPASMDSCRGDVIKLRGRDSRFE